ncbi:MAG: response regulator, partial [bacterium]|nr:response regulator [bacterium]
MSKLLILICLACFCCSSLYGLNPQKKIDQYILDNWNSDHGLPQNSINCITQTENGYLWIGCQGGIARFNGIDFDNYNETNTPILEKSQYITTFFKHRDDSIWIGTQDGYLIRMQNETFENPVPGNNPIVGTSIRALAEDLEGTIWIGTEKKGLWLLGKNGLRACKNKTISSFKSISAILRDRNGNMWLGSPEGLSLFAKGEYSLLKINEGLSSDDVKCICESHSGQIIVCTGGGTLNFIDGEKIRSYSFDSKMGNREILSIYEDRAHNLWLGTRNGLGRFKNGTFEFFNTGKGVSNTVISMIYEDREESLWFGTTVGLSRLRDGKVTNYTAVHGLSSELTWCVLEDKNGSIWVGTHGGGITRAENGDFDKAGNIVELSHSVVRSLFEDSQGRIWAGTLSGVSLIINNKPTEITFIDNLNIMTGKVVRSIYQDSKGTLWFGTSGGLLRLVGRKLIPLPLKEEFTNFYALCEDREHNLWAGTRNGAIKINLHDYSYKIFTTEDGFSSNVVLFLNKDNKGRLWFGTNAGLGRIKNGSFQFINSSDGLPNNSVYMAIEDTLGNLWISSPKGISRLKISNLHGYLDRKENELKIENFNRSDGLGINECNGGGQPAGWLSRRGRLYIPTSRGLAMIEPKSIRKNTVPPAVALREIIADNESISPGIETSLEAGTRKIEIHYTAISFIAPKEVQYKYILENFDKDWVDAGNRRTAYYTNLPPGKYRFKAIAANNDGVWNLKGAAYTFNQEPYFYQTFSFQVTLAVFFVFLGIRGYRYRIKRLKRRERDLEDMVSEQTRELREANKQIRREREIAESANRARGEFLARMSHEIRTPMNSIMGFNEMLRESGLREEQLDYAGTINRSSELLLTIINDILDFSKIEAGQLNVEYIDFDPEITIFDVYESIRPRIQDRNIELLCRIDDHVPAFVKGDPGRFRQVLLNLIGNSVKFTETGEIELSCDVEEENENNIKLHAIVRDTGIGIPEEKLESIFEVFQQADGSTTRKFGGTGLGLSISRQLAKLMGGHVWAENSQGQGCTFHFTAWLGKSRKSVGKKNEVKGLEGKKLLFVDDNKKNLEILSLTLQKYNIKVVTSRQPEKALSLLEAAEAERESYDIAILDLQMPGISGFQLAQQIRTANAAFSKMPLLAFSSSYFKGAEQSKKSGFNGFLSKPISRKKMLKMLQRLLQVDTEFSGQRGAGAEAIITQHSLAEETKHQACILLVEDNPINRKLATLMLTKVGYRVEVVENGVQAIETFVAQPHKY